MSEVEKISALENTWQISAGNETSSEQFLLAVKMAL